MNNRCHDPRQHGVSLAVFFFSYGLQRWILAPCHACPISGYAGPAASPAFASHPFAVHQLPRNDNLDHSVAVSFN